MIAIVVCVLLLVIGGIALVIAIKAKGDEITRYYDAAKKICQEKRLDRYIQNPYGNSGFSEQEAASLMVYLKMRDKNKSCFVFSLDRPIYIGRDGDENQVCVNEAMVSRQHCCVFFNEARVFVQDLNSSNGLLVKRGLKIYSLQTGGCMELSSKDRLQIGTTEIEVTIFWFDETVM